MAKIPPDDILEGLYKMRIRESEKLKTLLELYDLEIHMVKRSIEQGIRNKNFGARNGKFEKNAVVKNQGTKQRVQRILGDCWQWETNGQCSEGDNCCFRHDINERGKSSPSKLLRILSCGRMSENHREPEVPEVRVPVVAREMGSPRHVHNRRRRTRKGPEPACVQTLNPDRVAHAGERRMN